MKSLYPLSLVFLFVAAFYQPAYAQITTATGTFATPVITHKTCYSGASSISYTTNQVVTCPGRCAYTYDLANTRFMLRASTSAPGTALLSNTGGTVVGDAVSGSFDLTGLPPNMYTIDATVILISGSSSYVVTIPSLTFVVGYQTNWSSLLDMQANPNSYSVKRSGSTVTNARAISSNLLAASGDGWICLGPQYAGLTGTVYFVIGKTATSNTSATLLPNYVVFERTSSTAGTVKVVTGGTTYTLSGTDYQRRIFMRRTSGTIRFYPENSTTPIPGAPIISTVTGELNVGVFAFNSGDGFSNVLTSFPCVFDNQFYYLKDEVEQTMALVTAAETKLRFKFEEDYFDATGNLNYKIICLTDDVVPTTVTVTKPAHTNWIEVPLGSGGVAFTAGNTYLLEVTDAKGRKHYLKYKKL